MGEFDWLDSLPLPRLEFPNGFRVLISFLPVSTKIMRILVEGKAPNNLLLDKAFNDLELPLFDEEVLAGFDGTVHFTKQYLPQGAALKTP